jgi:hypothetical protein
MRNSLGVAFVCAALTACSSQSSVAPTPTSAPSTASTAQIGTLTVRVLARESEQPIVGAAVHSSTTTVTTDSVGVCIVPFVLGEELDLDVSATGYESMGASGMLGSNERWTFYLPKSH